ISSGTGLASALGDHAPRRSPLRTRMPVRTALAASRTSPRASVSTSWPAPFHASSCAGDDPTESSYFAADVFSRQWIVAPASRARAAARPRRAMRSEHGLRWIQAEHRVKPELLVAQTGWMQGAAGVGHMFLRMDAVDRHRKLSIRMPDSPFDP